jgi:hypothetical protein
MWSGTIKGIAGKLRCTCGQSMYSMYLGATRSLLGLGTLCLVTALFLGAQPATPVSDDPLSHERILGVIPNFQTVPDPAKPYRPLRVRDKWRLFTRETVDPYTIVSAAAGAALSQWHDGAPQYGVGGEPYLQRFSAALADVTTQNFFSDAVLASLLHEDPRYFRMGPGHSVVHRITYAFTRVAITRRDSGKDGFSFSGIGGMGLGIALSNAYYPPRSVNGGETGSRIITSLIASSMGNLLPEFWPDVKSKIDRLRHR